MVINRILVPVSYLSRRDFIVNVMSNVTEIKKVLLNKASYFPHCI